MNVVKSRVATSPTSRKMTEHHPLTDELAEDIAPYAVWSSDIGEVVFTHDDMRRSADWQLEQVIDELNKMIFEENLFFEDSFLSSAIDCLPR